MLQVWIIWQVSILRWITRRERDIRSIFSCLMLMCIAWVALSYIDYVEVNWSAEAMWCGLRNVFKNWVPVWYIPAHHHIQSSLQLAEVTRWLVQGNFTQTPLLGPHFSWPWSQFYSKLSPFGSSFWNFEVSNWEKFTISIWPPPLPP